MAAEAGGAALGPALFVGLSLFAIVTQGEPEIDPNPQTRLEEAALRAVAAPLALLSSAATGWASPADPRLAARSAAVLTDQAEADQTVQAQLAPAKPQTVAQLQAALAAPSAMAGALPLPSPNRATQLRSASDLARPPADDSALQSAPRIARPDLDSASPSHAGAQTSGTMGWPGSVPDPRRPIAVQSGLASPPARDGWAPAQSPVWLRLTADRVYLRPEASLRSAPTGLFARGSYAELIRAENKWIWVRIGGQTGWMWRAYLVPAAPE